MTHMDRVNKFKLIILFLSVFLLIPKPAMAFLPPSLLSLMVASIGGWIWVSFVIVSVNCILIFKFAKKIFKKKIIILFFIILIVFGGFARGRYKEIEDIDRAVLDTSSQLKIDLNTITNLELKKYRIFRLVRSIYDTLNVDNAEVIKNLEIEDMMQLVFSQATFNEFILENKITKKDKLLFLCEFGGMSRYLAFLFERAGYDAYFASLYLLADNRNNLISAEFIRADDSYPNLEVLPYESRDKQKKDLYLFFGLAYPSNFFILSDGNWDEVEILPYEKFRTEMIHKKNIVCSVSLHEMLTRYVLYSKGIEEAQLYKLPIELPKGVAH